MPVVEEMKDAQSPLCVGRRDGDGVQSRPGCVIGAREPMECDRCELACHREPSDLFDPRFVVDQLRTHLGKPWL